MPSNKWTQVSQLRTKLRARWDSGQLLAERLKPTGLFPLRLSLSIPNAQDMLNYFSEVNNWIDSFKPLAQINGFHVEWKTCQHRQLGRNELPCALVINDLASCIDYLDKRKASLLFDQHAKQLLSQLPQLYSWVLKYPLRLLELSQELNKLTAFILWRLAHPKPHIYLRQLSLPGINTKYLEQYQKTCSEWLDLCLPTTSINTNFKANRFALRYGFLEKPVLVRFRMLDQRYDIHGLSDLSISIESFANLDLKIAKIFIIENDINALAFPSTPDSMVLFGRGYGFEYLSNVHWLHDKKIVYWGDIDTHGFAILNQLRHYLPQAQSMLMDEATLLKHQTCWSIELKQSKAELSQLTIAEQALYQTLQHNILGQGVRLEQEYIDFKDVLSFNHQDSAS